MASARFPSAGFCFPGRACAALLVAAGLACVPDDTSPGSSGAATGDPASGAPGEAQAGVSSAVSDVGAGAEVDREAFERARNAAFLLVEEGAPSAQTATALEAARDLDPTAYGVQVRLGAALVDLKRYAAAREAYEAALTARPGDPVAGREVAWLCTELGDPARALVVLDEVNLQADRTGDALYLRGLALDQLGRSDEARDLLSDLPVTGADAARTLRGRLRLQDGRLDEAQADFAAVVASQPDDQAALRGLADAARRAGDGAAAARWDEVLTLLVALRDNRFARPATGKADRMLQRQASRNSEYIAAEVAAQELRLRRLNELHPEWAEGFELLAALLRRDDRLDEACAVIEELLARHGDRYDAERQTQLRERHCPEEGS